jgi:Domain of unknown function (DUF4864)
MWGLFRSALNYLDRPEPGPVGVKVDPLGEPLGASVLPEGFIVLLDPVAMPLVADPLVPPVGVPVDEPVVPMEPPPMEEPPPDTPPAEPPPDPPPDWASAIVLVSAKAPANAIVVSFMIMSLVDDRDKMTAGGLCSGHQHHGAITIQPPRKSPRFLTNRATTRGAVKREQLSAVYRLPLHDKGESMRALILLIALSIGFASPARAADDVAAARAVIRSQEKAFSRDDAVEAYSYAGPPITSLFRTADIFMWMVRRGYDPIYRHRRFEFGDARAVDGKITQKVYIIDADGVAWEALYTLEQQSDGSMKIIECVLSKAVGA